MLSTIMTKKRCATVALACTLAALCAIAGCAPQADETDSDPKLAGSASDAAPAVQVDWTPDADCALCHVEEGSSLASIPCTAQGGSDQPCLTCHDEEGALATVHEGTSTSDKMPKKLKATEVAPETCESCHESYDALAEKTADSTVLTDSQGTVVNPHALPESADHASVTCASCHQMHADGDASKTAPKACSSCHHAGVYECNTCHEAE